MSRLLKICAWPLLTALALCLLTLAQTPAPAKPKAGQQACDGALDVVPTKSATFMRKRRAPSKKPAAKTELKPANKSSL